MVFDIFKILGFFQKTLPVVAAVAASTSITMGALTYIESGEAEKRELSLSQVNEWTLERYNDDYTALKQHIRGLLKQDEVRSKFLKTGNSLQTYPIIFKNIGVTSRLESSLRNPSNLISTKINRLVEFFSKVEICLKVDLCDFEVTEAYFSEQVLEFWRFYKSYAYWDQENNRSNYGMKVEALCLRLTSYDKQDFCIDSGTNK